MKKAFVIIAVILGSGFYAVASEFCDGFEQGFKTVKGDMVMVPMCPMENLTPLGSTPYREGIKAGMRAANR